MPRNGVSSFCSGTGPRHVGAAKWCHAAKWCQFFLFRHRTEARWGISFVVKRNRTHTTWTPSLRRPAQRHLLDELGCLPIDKQGADLLFQVVAARYEVGSIVIATICGPRRSAARNWRWPCPSRRTRQTRTPGRHVRSNLRHAKFLVRFDSALFETCRAAPAYAAIASRPIQLPSAPPSSRSKLTPFP